MQTNVELSCKKNGVDNQMADALRNKDFAFRLTFIDEDNQMRTEVILSHLEASGLIKKIQKSFDSYSQIDKIESFNK